MTVHLDTSRGFGRRIGFGERPAVLAIDMVIGFTDPDLPLGSSMEEELGAARALLDAAREAGHPVLFSTVYYEHDGVWGLKIDSLDSILFGSSEGDIDPRLGMRDGDALVRKKYPSVFFGTDLASRLTGAGVDTLVVAGCSTSGCVRATVVDALSHGFRPIVVREAVADRSAPAHEQALTDMDDKYADVVALGDAVAALQRLARRQEEG